MGVHSSVRAALRNFKHPGDPRMAPGTTNRWRAGSGRRAGLNLKLIKISKIKIKIYMIGNVIDVILIMFNQT